MLEVFIKPFEAPQISVKIKIQVNFLSSSGIGTGRINKLKYNFIVYHAFNFIEQYVNAHDFLTNQSADILHSMRNLIISGLHLLGDNELFLGND